MLATLQPQGLLQGHLCGVNGREVTAALFIYLFFRFTAQIYLASPGD